MRTTTYKYPPDASPELKEVLRQIYLRIDDTDRDRDIDRMAGLAYTVKHTDLTTWNAATLAERVSLVRAAEDDLRQLRLLFNTEVD